MGSTLTSYSASLARKARSGRVCSLALRLAIVLCTLAGGLSLWSTAALADVAEEPCPNAASRQGPSINLPQCRAYEQVTPVEKGAAIDLFPSNGLEPIPSDRGYAAEDGNEFLLDATASIGASAPTGVGSYVFTRGADGWSTSVVVSPLDQVQLVEAEVFAPANLSEVGFQDRSGSATDLIAGNQSAFQNRKLVGPPNGPYATVSSLSGFSALEFSEESVHLVGGSAGLSRVVLESRSHGLVPAAAGQDAGSEALYEWAGGGECGSEGSSCKLINVNDDGSLLSVCGATLGQGTPSDHSETDFGGTHGAVSGDGSKILFTAPDPNMANSSEPGCWKPETQENPPQLYMRENGERTVEISAPEPAMVGVDPDGMQPAVFVGASANGSKVFFMTQTELTTDDTTHAPELYEYNTEPGPREKALTRISHGESGTAEGNVDFVGAVSSDGSSVYFTAFGKLTANASALAPQPKGADLFAPVNLYRYDTLTGTTTFITTLNAGDYPLLWFGEYEDWGGSIFGGRNAGRVESVGLNSQAEWYTTGDGGYLVFGTERPITGYNDTSESGVECQRLYHTGSVPKTCVELYRYDAASNSIVCVSCAGGAPIDDAIFARAAMDTPAGLPPRPISEDGEDVFFDTASALVPQAAPGKVHVYEWHDGTLSMISSPSDPGEAFFLGSSNNGNDVFFSTHAQLSPQDTDVSDDIYDARVDGGFPALAAPQCTGTGCQGVPAAPPIFATPSSVTFEGVGNFPAFTPAVKPISKPEAKAKKCRPGHVKKDGKCQKLKQRAKKPAKGRK